MEVVAFVTDIILNSPEDWQWITTISPEQLGVFSVRFVTQDSWEDTEIPNSLKQLTSILRNRRNYLSHLKSEEQKERRGVDNTLSYTGSPRTLST